MNTTSADDFYDAWERLRDDLAREEHGKDRFSEAAARLEATDDAEEADGDLEIGDDGFRVFDGSLFVRGDLTLSDGALLFVRGDLTVEGTIVARGHYTLLLVGGKLTTEALWASGELGALDGIEAKRVFWTRRNDYSAYSPRLLTPLYIAKDRLDSIDEFEVDERLQGHIAEIADDLSYEFGMKIWANREEFELDERRLESIIRIP